MNFPLTPNAQDRHLITLLKQRIEIAPGRPLVTQAGRYTDAESLLAQAEKYAAAMQASGLAPNDRVAMQCYNRTEFIAVLVACAIGGFILVPINTASRGIQLAYYLKNSRARIFVTETTLVQHLESASEADGEATSGLEAIWSLDACGAVKDFPQLISIDNVSQEKKVKYHPSDATSPALIMYTSGTSGPSKGVLCSHAQLYWWGYHSLENIGVEADDVLYTCLPLFHVNALNTFYQALMSGGTIALGGKFSVSHFYEELAKSNATVTYLLGAMLPMLLSRQPDASEKMHKVRIALAPGASAQHYEAFEGRTGIQMLDGFGSTETNFVICTPRHDRRPGSMGTVVKGFQARVVDENDQELPHGRPGELLLRSEEPYAFSLGYFEMPEKTVEAWRNLWFHTGDRVVRDDEGFFKFIDRMKDSIRRRGENISSYEVEQVVGSYPAIAGVAAYAVPSELAEDEVMCALVLKDSVKLDPLELIRWVEGRLPYFAVPRFLRVITDLPKTENGKVQKYKLREQGRTADTWDLAATGHVVKR